MNRCGSWSVVVTLSLLLSATFSDSAHSFQGKSYEVAARSKKKKRRVKKESVDLGSLNSSDSSGNSGKAGGYGASRYIKGSGIADKKLKAYFDFAVFSQPGLNGFSFANFHSYIFLEVSTGPKLEFMTDISSSRGSPSFYEIDWHLSDRLVFRAGKIWIPFDIFSPHNLFGGRTNISIIQQDAQYRFLPNLWTELGAGLKYRLVDQDKVQADVDGYVVNGFGGSGVDPLGRNTSYPSFADVGIASLDNNRAKSIGGRTHILMGHKFGLGISYYRGRWNDESETKSNNLEILGADAQVYAGLVEIRGGVAQMIVQLETEKFRRGGAYGELGFKLSRAWKVLGRAGFLQTDDRVIDSNDQQHVGGTALYRYKYMEFSLTHSRDLRVVSGKKNYSYSAFRMILQL